MFKRQFNTINFYIFQPWIIVITKKYKISYSKKKSTAAQNICEILLSRVFLKNLHKTYFNCETLQIFYKHLSTFYIHTYEFDNKLYIIPERKGLLLWVLSILSISSYNEGNLLWNAKIHKKREIMTLLKKNPPICSDFRSADPLIFFTIKF